MSGAKHLLTRELFGCIWLLLQEGGRGGDGDEDYAVFSC